MSDNQMTAEQAKKNLKDAEGKPQKGEGGAKGGIAQRGEGAYRIQNRTR